MVARDYQLPDYRHILVTGATAVRFYHFNPEHSVANANSEFLSSSNISVFGTKSEGHAATIWVRNCSQVFHSGHAGNANPESCDSETCNTWAPSPCACNWTAGPPTLFRVEGCRGECRFGNIWTQRHQPQKQYFGRGWTAGQMETLPYERPVVVGTSDSLRCVRAGSALACE